jgi:hypothetical protein
MNVVIGILLVVLLLAVGIFLFMRANPARLAGSVRMSGPSALLLAGFGAALAGWPAIGAGFVLAALAFYALRNGARRPRPTNQRSMVRTAALEMELDHRTGALEGLVLAGRAEGRMLGTMSLPELTELFSELSSDADSRQLLETYLDARFPAWRADVQANGNDGLGVAPGAGAMTKEEAYKVLGLEAGAAAADVRKAHRRLMQRLNPDVHRASFLAARIDQAKDVLLSDHG